MVRDYSTAWRALLCLERGMRVLEVSRDGGERAEALAEDGTSVVCLRPSRAEAAVLEARGFETVVCTSSRECDEAGPFDAVVVSATTGCEGDPGWGRAEIVDLLRHLPVASGAALLLSQANPLYRLPGVSRLAAWVGGGTRQPLGSGGSMGSQRSWSVRELRELLLEAGFTTVGVFAPLPAAHRPKFLLPLDEPAAVDYFFEFLMPRPRSRSRRAMVGLARLVAGLGLFDRFVPGYEIVASKGTRR